MLLYLTITNSACNILSKLLWVFAKYQFTIPKISFVIWLDIVCHYKWQVIFVLESYIISQNSNNFEGDCSQGMALAFSNTFFMPSPKSP